MQTLKSIQMSSDEFFLGRASTSSTLMALRFQLDEEIRPKKEVARTSTTPRLTLKMMRKLSISMKERSNNL